MSVVERGRLADYTTLRLGGPSDDLVEVNSRDELVAAVTAADAAGDPLLLVAGGSNLVVSDDGFRGTTIVLRSKGFTVTRADGEVTVTVQAGHEWDDLVAAACDNGWSGVECLSGIPGSTGATPIQNVGAYGQEISSTFLRAEVLDRTTGEIGDFTTDDCRFGYRDSVFKHTDRYVVLTVTYRFTESELSQPIRYAETAKALGVEVGDRVPARRARETVLGLRRGKGMVLDPDDHDTYSAGSFFVNPVISPAQFEDLRARTSTEPPHWPSGADVKVSAAWLIGRAGFQRGYGHDGVSISGKHTLALTNRGDGTTKALMSLAREIRGKVAEDLGITLRPEPTMVGIDW